MKKFIFICLLSVSVLFAFSSCVKYEGTKKIYPAKEYLVASEEGCYSDGNGLWATYYFVKKKGSAVWETYDWIEGFDYDYERGYEYRIKAERIEDKGLLQYADIPSYIYLRLVEVLSVEKKDTEGLPDNRLIYSDELPPPDEYFPCSQE